MAKAMFKVKDNELAFYIGKHISIQLIDTIDS